MDDFILLETGLGSATGLALGGLPLLVMGGLPALGGRMPGPSAKARVSSVTL